MRRCGSAGSPALAAIVIPIPQALAIGHLIFNGIILGLIAWTITYVRRSRDA